jgi:hypothetical protein
LLLQRPLLLQLQQRQGWAGCYLHSLFQLLLLLLVAAAALLQVLHAASCVPVLLLF